MRKIPAGIASRLIAAADPIAHRGLNDTKIEDIVDATGIPKATLYYYFDGKESVFAFLLQDLLKQLAEEVGAAADTTGTGAHRLINIISAQLHVLSGRPAVCRALLGELSRAGGMSEISEMLDDIYIRPLENVLLAGVADGSISAQEDVRGAAVALIGAVTAIAITYLVAEEDLDHARVTDTVCAVVLSGLLPH